ncbi:LIC10775 family protein [Leptospira inadai]|nr:hypothetical protein [Leptospira inadai]
MNLRLTVVSFFSLAVFLVSRTATAQDGEIDPLLRQPWFADQEKKEELLYNKLQSAFRLSAHYVWKTDSRGRNYRFYKDGRVEFVMDRDWKEVFPKTEELDLHYSEAESLRRYASPYAAIRLLKGMGVCYNLQYGKLTTESGRKASSLLGQYLDFYSHKEKELSRLTDPFGCLHAGRLRLRSTDYAYSLDLDPNLQYLFPDEDREFSGEDSDLRWQVHRFYKNLPTEALPKNWEGEYRKGSEGLLFFRPDRILFTIGTSLHFHPMIFDAKNYYMLWDALRGINARTMHEWNYLRKKENDIYRTTFTATTPDGRRTKMVILEKFYLRGKRGLLFTLSFPEQYEPEAKKIWDRFSSTVVVE